MNPPSLKSIVEGLIFVADAPLTIDRLCAILNEFERAEIRAALEELGEDCDRQERGIFLAEVAEGYQFRTRPEQSDYVRRLVKTAASRLSKPALETLAIIAYRQPLTRSEIEYLRGVESGGVLKTLLEKNLIRIMGKKNIPGKPLIYGTSKRFLEIFNLPDLKSLPTLREIRELEEDAVYERQEELPLEKPS